MGHKILIDGVAYDITGGRCLDDGVGYSIKKGRTLVDGVGHDVSFGVNGTPVGELAVGSSVYTNVNGVRTEFLVVHQGNPSSSLYDASCDGTWLMRKFCTDETVVWDASGVDTYNNSDIHTYLNGTFLQLLDSGVRRKIKTVKIPYQQGNGSSTVISGSNGLYTNVFLPSACELGQDVDGRYITAQDGVKLDYFIYETVDEDACRARRAGYDVNGVARDYSTRTPRSNSKTTINMVSRIGPGSMAGKNVTSGLRFREIFIMYSDTAIDPDTFDILE